MESRPALVIGGIVGGVLLAFISGMIFAIMVMTPAREYGLETASATGEPTIQATQRTPTEIPLTPTLAVSITTPEPAQPTPTSVLPGATPTPVPSITTTPVQRPTLAPSPTPTSRFPFYYVEGSRIEQDNCHTQYLKGRVVDANDAPLDGVTVRWERWGVAEFYISGSDPVGPRGQWTFDYMPERPRMETDFVLQIVESEENPAALSEPLMIHYAGCFETGQITRIVFKRRW